MKAQTVQSRPVVNFFLILFILACLAAMIVIIS